MNRLIFIDNAKGIGIILMILGHISNIPDIIHGWIYSFHMPLFFFISGYLFNKDKYPNIKGYVMLKFNRLIVPYFGMAFICYFIMVFLLGKYENAFKWILGILYSRGTVEWMPNCSPLWFLTCLFVVEIIIYNVIKNMKKDIYIFIIIIILGLLGTIVYKFILIKLPWNIDTAIIASIFSLVGFLVRKYNIFDKIKKYNEIVFIICILCSYISAVYNENAVNLDGNKYGDLFLFYLGAFSGIMIIILICRKIDNIKYCSFLGKNTMPIIGFNYMIMLASLKISKIFIEINWICNFFITLILTFMFIYILINIRNKHKLISKIFFGN